MFKVIGDLVEDTIAQARNVLEKGADRFVLCDDGLLVFGHVRIQTGSMDEALHG